MCCGLGYTPATRRFKTESSSGKSFLVKEFRKLAGLITASGEYLKCIFAYRDSSIASVKAYNTLFTARN